MQVAPGIHHFHTSDFNWYLIEEGGAFTLVDAGFPAHYSVFAAGLMQLGKTLKDIKAIFITHAHMDHIGFAQRASEESGAPIFIHRADVKKAARLFQLPWVGLLGNTWRTYTRSMVIHATLNGVFSTPRVTPTTAVDDGAVLDIPGKPRVIHVPGHTPGQSVLYLADRGVLFSGDALITRDLFTGGSIPPSVPHQPINWNYPLALQSAREMKSLGSLRLLPGHGEPWDGDPTVAIHQVM